MYIYPYIFWQDRKVSIVITHQKFDPKTFEYDLALLRFHEPVKFQPNIIPVCIPEEDRDMVGQTAWVTGWGRLYEGQHTIKPFWTHVGIPRVLHTVRKVLADFAACD